MTNQKKEPITDRQQKINQLSVTLEQIRQICINEILEHEKTKLNSTNLNDVITCNLFDKLKVNSFKKLNTCFEKYPYVFADVITDLKNNNNLFNLKYQTITRLNIYNIIDSIEPHDVGIIFS